jgi:hypothetical protein
MRFGGVGKGLGYFGVDKLWKTWDTYTRTTLANSLIHRMVRTTQDRTVPQGARTVVRGIQDMRLFRPSIDRTRLPVKVPAMMA